MLDAPRETWLRVAVALVALGAALHLLYVGAVGEASESWVDGETQTFRDPKPTALWGVPLFLGLAYTSWTKRWRISWGFAAAAVVFAGAFFLSFTTDTLPVAIVATLLLGVTHWTHRRQESR